MKSKKVRQYTIILDFVSIGEGTMTIIQQLSADNYKILETFITHPGARTITLDKSSHRIYLPVGEYLPGTGRKPLKSSSFHLIELETIQ
jgi:hypothetical protein